MNFRNLQRLEKTTEASLLPSHGSLLSGSSLSCKENLLYLVVLIRTFAVGWLHFNTSVCFLNFHSFLFMKIVSFQLQRMKPVHLTTSIYNPPNIPLSVRAGPSSSFLACFPPSSCLPALSLLLLEGGARGEERFLHTKAGPKLSLMSVSASWPTPTELVQGGLQLPQHLLMLPLLSWHSWSSSKRP